MEEQSVCSSCLRDDGTLKETDPNILNTTNGPLSGEMVEACLETACPAGVFQDPDTPPVASPVHVSQSVAQRAGHVVLEDKELVLLENHEPELKFHNYQFIRGQGQCSLLNRRIGFIPGRSLCQNVSNI